MLTDFSCKFQLSSASQSLSFSSVSHSLVFLSLCIFVWIALSFVWNSFYIYSVISLEGKKLNFQFYYAE